MATVVVAPWGTETNWIGWVVMNTGFQQKVQRVLGVGISAEQYLASWQETVARLKHDGAKQEDIENAILECAAFKLSPAVGQVTAVAYESKRTGVVRVDVMITARGMQTLMMRACDVADVEVCLVHKGDNYRLTNGQFFHEYDPFDPDRNINGPEDIKGGYLKVTYRDGHIKYHFVPVVKIERMRQCAAKQAIWSEWYREMAMKSVIRDAFARQVITIDPMVQIEISRAIARDDAVLENTPIPRNGTSDVQQEHPIKGNGNGALSFADRIASATTVQELSQIASEIAKSRIDNQEKDALRNLWASRLAVIKAQANGQVEEQAGGQS